MHIPLLLLLLLTTPPLTSALPNPNPNPQPLQHNGGAAAAAANRKATEEPKQAPKETKYFHEAGGSLELGHYDARYFHGEVPYNEHGPALRRLIRSWLTTTRELGVDTWLAHGTLLGWWWNGKVMPWDYDLDVQMPTGTLAYLGRHFNGTLHDYTFLTAVGDGGLEMLLLERRSEAIAIDGGGGGGSINNGVPDINARETAIVNKTYLLDINPYHTAATRGSGHNVIDARWIDVSSGLFIDITGLMEREAAEKPGVWSCKNAHRYRTAELYPLRRTEFEGVPAYVPFAFDKILTDEYGDKSLTTTEWSGHRWVPELKEWVKNPEPTPNKDEAIHENTEQKNNNAVVVVVEKTVVKGSQ